MASLLSERTGEKGNPVIYNGKLLMYGKRRVLVKSDRQGNFKPVFFVRAAKDEIINLTTGEGMPNGGEDPETGASLRLNEAKLLDMTLEFDRKYAPVWFRDPASCTTDTIEASVDTCTGAIVLESELYRRTMEPESFHRVDKAYKPEEIRVRAELLLEYIDNYYDIFTHLLNPRLNATSTPFYVKGHLVAGLFQPIRIATDKVRSPFDYPILSPFSSILNGKMEGLTDGLGNIETVLLPSAEENQPRGMHLTVASMYDFAHRFFVDRGMDGTGAHRAPIVPKELKRQLFVYLLLQIACVIIAPNYEGDYPISAHHPLLEENLMQHKGIREFAFNVKSAYDALSSQIAVR